MTAPHLFGLVVLASSAFAAKPEIISILSPISGVPEFIPGSLFLINGRYFGAQADSVRPGKPLEDALGGVTVKFGSTTAPLMSVTGIQIQGQVPVESSFGETTVTVITSEGQSTVDITIVDSAPSLLTNATGQPWVLTPRFEFVTSLKPGMDVVLYATGLGPMRPRGKSGRLPPRNAELDPRYEFRLQGLPAQIDSVEAEPTSFGIFRINAHILDAPIQTPLVQAHVFTPDGFVTSRSYPIPYSRPNSITVKKAKAAVAYPSVRTLATFSPFPEVCSLELDLSYDDDTKPFIVTGVFEDESGGAIPRSPLMVAVFPEFSEHRMLRGVPEAHAKQLDFTELTGIWSFTPLENFLGPSLRIPILEPAAVQLLQGLPDASADRVVEGTPLAQSREEIGTSDNRLVIGGDHQPFYFGGFIAPAGGTRSARCRLYVDGVLVSEDSVGINTP